MPKEKKVTHRYFQSGEYAYLDNGKIFFEDGCSIDTETFWKDREADHWNADWEVIPDDVIQIEMKERTKAMEVRSRNAGKYYLVEEIELGAGANKKTVKYEEGILIKGTQHKARVIATGKVRIIL